MTTEQKVIKTKVGLLELAKQLGSSFLVLLPLNFPNLPFNL